MASKPADSVMEDPVPEWIVEAVQRMGFAEPGELVRGRPLKGGVSSDVYVVEVGGRRICVKRPLETLRVLAPWHAPLGRGQREHVWLRFAAEVCGDLVPRILGADDGHHALAMEFLDQRAFGSWKSQLLEGLADPAVASTLGRQLAALHRASSASPEMMRRFADQQTFDALRVDPFYRALLPVHPEVEGELHQLMTEVFEPRAVIHGDVSPKNVLVGTHRVVLIDAECASVGDPAFDVAFCLAHLTLKSLRRPEWRQRYRELADTFLSGYCAGMPRPEEDRLLGAAARHMGGLLVARVDGKSPVEYLTSAQRDTARKLGVDVLRQPPPSPAAVFCHLADQRTWSSQP